MNFPQCTKMHTKIVLLQPQTEREDAQRRTLSRYVAHTLGRLGDGDVEDDTVDVVNDSRDGTLLASFLKALTGQDMVS